VPVVAYERLAKGSDLRWFPHEKVMQWINSISSWRDKLMAKLLYRSGMRRAELLSLQTTSIPEKGSVNVARAEVGFEIRGKGGRRRPVHVATRDFLALHDYLAIRRRSVLRAHRLDHEAIWISERTGQPLRVEALNEIFSRVSRRCGIRLTPHMLRHSFAVFALAHFRGMGHAQPEKLLQLRLGHASIVTTSTYYMHMTPDQLAQDAHAAASLIERLLEYDLDATREQVH
jgi:site-specific recombinase XerD